jgi:hypothetical protein
VTKSRPESSDLIPEPFFRLKDWVCTVGQMRAIKLEPEYSASDLRLVNIYQVLGMKFLSCKTDDEPNAGVWQYQLRGHCSEGTNPNIVSLLEFELELAPIPEETEHD